MCAPMATESSAQATSSPHARQHRNQSYGGVFLSQGALLVASGSAFRGCGGSSNSCSSCTVMRHNLVLQVAAGTTSCTTHEQIAAALAKGQAGRQGCRRAGRRADGRANGLADGQAGGRTGRRGGSQEGRPATHAGGQALLTASCTWCSRWQHPGLYPRMRPDLHLSRVFILASGSSHASRWLSRL